MIAACTASGAVFAPLVATDDPLKIDLVKRLASPSSAHWMGTDVQGRDIWSRLVYGARVSLAVGLISQAIALTLGVIFGLLAGYYGRWVDELVMRLADVTLAFPTLLLLIAMVAALAVGAVVQSTQPEDELFLLRVILVASGWSFGYTLIEMGRRLNLSRYIWVGAFGIITTTPLLLLSLTVGQAGLGCGLLWGAALAVSSIQPLREAMQAAGETRHD